MQNLGWGDKSVIADIYTTLNEWYIRLTFTVLYTFNIQKLGFRTTTQERYAYSNEEIQHRSVYLG